LTGSDAAGASDAQVVVSQKERLILYDRQVLRLVTGSILSDSYVFCNPLQLTVTKLRATALLYRNVR
jgi:hypothetical protein